ncbi:MAG TPA: undecaprenyl-diphosphatase UppP [Luteitalea sp.]|nr:undecaprenyl-diphosphatase UppP [Luteitalea sp.]
MPVLLAAVLLGVVQGLTEFLPVSSSAHLILARAFFGWDDSGFGLAFDVATHVGTLLAIFVYFREDIIAMIRALPGALTGTDQDSRRIRLIAIGTIPVVIVGGLGADAIEAHLRTPQVAAVTLAIGAVLFFVVERVGAQWRQDDRGMSAAQALVFGLAQSTALVPGVSRSGSTIVAGMLMGFTRAGAARFGFLLGIPAILAAAAKEALKFRHVGLAPGDATLFLVGGVTAFIVGYLTVRFFMRYLANHRLDLFAWYRLGLAATVVVWLAVR